MTIAMTSNEGAATAPGVGNPAAEPPATLWLEDIAHVVTLAAQAEGIALDPDAVARTAKRRHGELGPGRHPFLVLSATAVEHGLSASLLRCTPDQLVDRIDEGVTLVAEMPHAMSGFAVVSQSTSGGMPTSYEVIEGHIARPLTSARALFERLGSEPIEVLAIESAYPLDVLGGDRGPRSAFQKLGAIVQLERSELITVLFYAVIIGVLTLVVPVSVQALVNTIAFGSVLQPLIILGVAVFAGMALSAVLQTLRYHVVEVIQQRLFARVATDFGRRLPRIAAAIGRTSNVRELSNRFFDVVTLQKTAAALTVDALGLALQTVMGLVLLGFYHPMLLAFDVVLILSLIALVAVPLRSSTKSAMDESAAKYATAAWLQTVADNPQLYSDARGGLAASAHTQRLAHDYLVKRAAHWRVLVRQIAGGLGLQVIAAVALLLIGGWLVIRGQLTLGQLVASELVVAVIGAGIAKLGKQLEKLYDAAAAIDKIGKVVAAERERDGGEQVIGNGPASLQIHVDDDRLACAVDVTIAPGETWAITGPAASGKSSLLRYVFGSAQPRGGSVEVDGVDLSRADLRHYRSSVCLLEADARAPEITIHEYLQLHAPLASVADIHAALAEVGLSRAIARLPEALETVLHPSGGPLSRSELLRLGIARLLLQQPRLALIDGTLDALSDDPALLDTVLDRPWTTLVATNSPAVLARASSILTLSHAGGLQTSESTDA